MTDAFGFLRTANVGFADGHDKQYCNNLVFFLYARNKKAKLFSPCTAQKLVTWILSLKLNVLQKQTENDNK